MRVTHRFRVFVRKLYLTVEDAAEVVLSLTDHLIDRPYLVTLEEKGIRGKPMISRSPESLLSDFLFNKEISCVLLVGTGRLPLKTKKPWDENSYDPILLNKKLLSHLRFQ